MNLVPTSFAHLPLHRFRKAHVGDDVSSLACELDEGIANELADSDAVNVVPTKMITAPIILFP